MIDIAYLPVYHINDRVFMPISNSKQIRYVLNKEFYGNTKLFINIDDAILLLDFLDNVKIKILNANITLFYSKDSKFINAVSFIPFQVITKKSQIII